MARSPLVLAQPTGQCHLPRRTLDECGGRHPRVTKRGAAWHEVIEARFGGHGVRGACVSLRVFVGRACVRELCPHRRAQRRVELLLPRRLERLHLRKSPQRMHASVEGGE